MEYGLTESSSSIDLVWGQCHIFYDLVVDNFRIWWGDRKLSKIIIVLEGSRRRGGRFIAADHSLQT